MQDHRPKGSNTMYTHKQKIEIATNSHSKWMELFLLLAEKVTEDDGSFNRRAFDHSDFVWYLAKDQEKKIESLRAEGK